MATARSANCKHQENTTKQQQVIYINIYKIKSSMNGFSLLLCLSVAHAFAPQQLRRPVHNILHLSDDNNAAEDDRALNKWSRYVCVLSYWESSFTAIILIVMVNESCMSTHTSGSSQRTCRTAS